MKKRTAAKAALVLDHVVFEAIDPIRLANFYAAVLGFAPVRLAEYGDGAVLFPSARINRTTVIDFFPRSMWRGAKPANPNHFCLAFNRPAVTALKRRLRAHRIPIDRTDDHNFGARGFGRALYFKDPEGNTIEARCY